MLTSKIIQYIEMNQGWISFQDFMEQALYTPGLGYYESARVFGDKGDFVTAPDLGKWLARAISDMLAWSWQQLGQPKTWSVLEQGGGQGALLCQVHQLLLKKKVHIPKYIAIERSQYLRQQQANNYAQHAMQVQQFSSLTDVPKQEKCVAFCNELLDAFPCGVFKYQEGVFFNMGVSVQEQALTWKMATTPLESAPPIAEKYIEAWPEGYQSEWNPAMEAWLASLQNLMQQGFILCIDYGYVQAEYYRPQRQMGSLLAHYQHQTNEDFFKHVGQQDLTAHVDFSALHAHAKTQGLKTLSFLSQTGFLAQSPSVQQHVAQVATSTSKKDMQEKAHLQRLVHPFQMGEVFKTCLLSKNMASVTPDYLQQFQSLDKLTS